MKKIIKAKISEGQDGLRRGMGYVNQIFNVQIINVDKREENAYRNHKSR